MFTALVSPEYAEQHGHKAAVEGGFIAHGLVPQQRNKQDYTDWFYALLPGAADEADDRHIRPVAAEQVERVLRTERDRYREMAQSDGDTVWADAAASIDDMLVSLNRARELSTSSDAAC